MPLFDVAVIIEPTKKEKDDGELEKLIHCEQWIVAANERAAGFEAAIKASKKEDFDMARMKVLVRPFA